VTQFVTRHYGAPRIPRDSSAHKRLRRRALACFGRLVPRLPERGVRSDGVPSRRATTIDRTEPMYTPCLLLAALIISAFPPSAHQQRGAAPTGGVTIVERLRSEFLSVLVNEAGAAEDVSLPAGRFNPYLTRVRGARAAYAESSAEVYSATRAIEKPDGLPSPQPTFRRGSSCWWLWLLFGNQLCW
jgi:hypothetical protein